MAFRFDDAGNYTDGTPFNEFARIRNGSPLAQYDGKSSRVGRFWLVTKHKDVVQVSRNTNLFVTKAPLLVDPLPKDLWPEFPALTLIADNLATYDDDKHRTYRPLINSLFTPQLIASVKASVKDICAQRLGYVSSLSEFDFATEIALPIATRAILGEFLGVPKADLEVLQNIILSINAPEDPQYNLGMNGFIKSAEFLLSYATQLIAVKSSSAPTDDIFSRLIHLPSGINKSARDLFFVYWFPLIAGAFDTTASVIAGGTLALLSNPDQMSLLCSDKGLIPQAVDEMLRWVSPVIYFRRTAADYTEVSGVRIAKGDKLVLCYASANRDEDVFENANIFQINRRPNPHLSFGYGPHFCLGSRIATMVIEAFLEELTFFRPGLICTSYKHTRSAWMNRMKTMWVQKAPLH